MVITIEDWRNNHSLILQFFKWAKVSRGTACRKSNICPREHKIGSLLSRSNSDGNAFCRAIKTKEGEVEKSRYAVHTKLNQGKWWHGIKEGGGNVKQDGHWHYFWANPFPSTAPSYRAEGIEIRSVSLASAPPLCHGKEIIQFHSSGSPKLVLFVRGSISLSHVESSTMFTIEN